MDSPPTSRPRWRRTRSALTWIIGFVVVAPAGTVFMLGRIGSGLPEALCNPWALQCWIALFVALVPLALLRSWRCAALALALVIWSSMVVLPHAFAPRVNARPDAANVRVVETNVLAFNAPARGAIDWLRSIDADIVGVVECSHDWAAAVAALRDRLPHQELHPAPDPSGIGLLSRYPLRDARCEKAPLGYFPHIEAIVEFPFGDVRVFVVHPPPPVRRDIIERRDAEIAWLGQRCAASDVPTIVIGDFNETQFGGAHRRFVEESGYRSARDGRLFATTWPSRLPSDGGVALPAWLRIAIDQCFVSRHFAAQAFEVGPDLGSDHLPIVADLLRQE